VFVHRTRFFVSSHLCFALPHTTQVSEGMDFSDGAARAVVITGIPFPMLKDPKVRLKRAFLDDPKLSRELAQRNGSKPLSGKDWYAQQSARAINQAVGRVIR
jgi:regulator of telomere elongation helicase 1